MGDATQFGFDLRFASFSRTDCRRRVCGQWIPRGDFPGTSDVSGLHRRILFLDSLRTHHPGNSAGNLPYCRCSLSPRTSLAIALGEALLALPRLVRELPESREEPRQKKGIA